MPISRTIYKAVTTAHTACCVGIGALLLTSCSTPPKPPSVDESTKRPVNARAAVDLKACQGDLSRATILVSEMARAGVVATSLTKALPLPGGCFDKCRRSGRRGCNRQSGGGRALRHGLCCLERRTGGRRSTGAARQGRSCDHDPRAHRCDRRLAAGNRAGSPARRSGGGVSAAGRRVQGQAPPDLAGCGRSLAGLRPADRSQSRRVEIEFYTAAPMLVSLRSSAANGKGTTAASL